MGVGGWKRSGKLRLKQRPKITKGFMKRLYPVLLTFILLTACNLSFGQRIKTAAPTQTLSEARKGFTTKLTRRESADEPVETPDARFFQQIAFESPIGKLAAYLTPDPKDGQKHPAIIWITGGDCNTIGNVWKEAPTSNDQTASAYRKAGLIMMFPSLRGGNQNPGVKESFLGEVDDVLAAAQFIKKLPYVDATRVYLGGHSTGGTLVLLVAESTDQFRAVFSFGPTEDIAGYGPEYMPFNFQDKKEVQLRSPGYWLHSIRIPTFVFEGTRQGNIDSLMSMSRSNKNSQVQFFPIRNANHFSVLAPVNQLIANKILLDKQPQPNLIFPQEELNAAFGQGGK